MVQTQPVTNNVVISQVYGGGGNTGATFKNDFIELINHSIAVANVVKLRAGLPKDQVREAGF